MSKTVTIEKPETPAKTIVNPEESHAVRVQTRAPGDTGAFQLDPKRHYVKVEEPHPDALNDILEVMLNRTSPIAHPGEPEYIDHGFVKGICDNKRWHLLSRDVKDYKYDVETAANVSNKLALGTTDVAPPSDGRILEGGVTVNRSGPRRLKELGIDREVDPVTGY